MPEQLAWRYCGKCHLMFYDADPSNKGSCAAGHGHEAYGFNFNLPFLSETPNAQPFWRYCGKCHAMFYDGDARNKGRCAAGDAHVPNGFNFNLPHDLPPRPNGQPLWRYCGKCWAMFYDGDPSRKGSCAASGAHAANGFNFNLPHDLPQTPNTQSLWRFCGKCWAMFYKGDGSNEGRCAAGGGHEANGFNFVLPFLPETPNAQPLWRYCGKCRAMFYDADGLDKGRCAAGGAHEAFGFNFNLPHDLPETPDAQAAWRYCGKCWAMFYEGDGSNKGMCAAGGAHAANGFNFRLPHLDGIPEVLPFHGNVVTPAGTALGGTVDMTLRSDGSYTVNFDMRATGLLSYDFLVRAIFTTPNGLTLVSQYSGHVEGTESGLKPHRESSHTDSGINPLIADNWSDIKNGRLWITKEYAADGLVGFVQDLAKAVLDVGAGAVGGTLGVVIGLGAEIGQVFGHLGVGGAFGLVAGVVVFASGASLVLAVVSGVAVGAVTNALIKQRPLSAAEAEFAQTVFGASLPAPDRIVLTNLSGLGGRAFTMPGADGKVYMNLGDGFDKPNPLQYTSSSYPTAGQLLIHELTHAWQIAHTSFLPGLVCAGIVNQANYTVGQDIYQYGPPGPLWGNFNLEQQGAIVDQWFAGDQTVIVPNRSPMNPNDPYFVYIRDNLRAGRT